MPERKLCLSLIDQQHIRDPALGLNEPSGLSLNADGTALYTVSDDSKAIFRLSLNGSVDAAASFLIDSSQLEGLAISGDGKHIHTVQEGSNSVISYDITSRCEITRRSLTDMANYRSVAKHFEQSPANKGLEGITVNTKSGHIVVLKEGQPGLLIDINLSEGRICSSRLLSDTNGFSHSQISKKKLDFSGISYDSSRDTFWISSDKGQCLYHYNWQRNHVLQRLELTRETGQGSSKVRKAEGIAIDPKRQRLYVVSDRDGDLYTYQIHPDD